MITASFVQKLVDKAFKKVDGLLATATFSNTKATGFDFNSKLVVSTQSVVETKGLLTTKEVKSVEGATFKTVLIVKSTAVQYSLYNTVTIDGKSYRCSVMHGDPFVTYVELSNV